RRRQRPGARRHDHAGQQRLAADQPPALVRSARAAGRPQRPPADPGRRPRRAARPLLRRRHLPALSLVRSRMRSSGPVGTAGAASVATPPATRSRGVDAPWPRTPLDCAPGRVCPEWEGAPTPLRPGSLATARNPLGREAVLAIADAGPGRASAAPARPPTPIL